MTDCIHELERDPFFSPKGDCIDHKYNFVFINWIAGLSFDFPLLKYCSHTSCCSGDDTHFLPVVLEASLVQGTSWL